MKVMGNDATQKAKSLYVYICTHYVKYFSRKLPVVGVCFVSPIDMYFRIKDLEEKKFME